MKLKAKRILALALSFSLCVGSMSTAFADTTATATTQIAVLATSDVHGQIFTTDSAAAAAAGNAGLARAATVIGSIRNSVKNVVLVDNGDTSQGTVLNDYYKLKEPTTEDPMIKLLRVLHYDAWVMGNHEFNFGMTALNKQLTDAQAAATTGTYTQSAGGTGTYDEAPVTPIDGNIYTTASGGTKTLLAPYMKKTFTTASGGTFTVGVLGLTTPNIPNWDVPGNYDGLQFGASDNPSTRLALEVKKYVPIMKADGCDAIIVSVHSGLETDAQIPNKENQVRDLIEQTTGVDGVIYGHDHIANVATVNNAAGKAVPIVNPGKCTNLSELDLTVNADKTFTVTAKNNPLTDAAGATESTQIQDIMAPYATKAKAYSSQVIGTTSDELSGNNWDCVNSPSALMDLVQKAQLWKTGADLSITAPVLGGNFDLKPGNITVQDAINLYMYDNNTLFCVNLTGAQIKAWLEYAASLYNSDGTYATKNAYDIDQIAGNNKSFSYDIYASQPIGSRVMNVTFGGQPLDMTKTYKVAMTNYRFCGGSYYMQNLGLNTADPSVIAKDPSSGKPIADGSEPVFGVIQDYIKAQGTIKADVISNWKVHKTDAAPATSNTVSVLATSDVHGQIYPVDYSTGTKPAGKCNSVLTKAFSVISSVRSQNPNTMLIDNGDTIQGTPISFYSLQYKKDAPEAPIVKAMRLMGYDTWELGNHEFNYGMDVLSNQIAQAQAPAQLDASKAGFVQGEQGPVTVLGSNVLNATDSTCAYKPYKIRSFTLQNGKTVKVGILGIENPNIPSWEVPEHYKGLVFGLQGNANDTSFVSDVNYWVPKMKADGANVVIVSAHSGLEDSSADATNIENQVLRMVNGTNNIDAVVYGHDHIAKVATLKNKDSKDIPIINPGKGANVSQLDITFAQDGTFSISTKNNLLTDDTPVNGYLAYQLQSAEDAAVKWTATAVGKATDDFSGKDLVYAPSAVVDLVNRAQLGAVPQAQLSISAPLSATDGAVIPKGDITLAKLMQLYTFDNWLYGIKMTGQQVKDWMEHAASYYTLDANGKPTTTYANMYIDVLYGAHYDLDLSKPVGQRVTNLTYNGKPLDLGATFIVAINNYRFSGGYGYMVAAGLKPSDTSIVTFGSEKTLGEDAGNIRNIIASYIAAQKDTTVSPAVQSDWAVLNAADQSTADAVSAKITALPSTITLADSDTVSAARAAYDALTATQKTLVANLAVLTAAEQTISDLTAADQSAADAVSDKIAALPSAVSSKNAAAIKAARAAYDALTTSQKALVTNYDTLKAAEQTLSKIATADKNAANAVIKKIAALPAKITLKNSAAVKAARAAYNALTNTRKLLVTNYKKLKSAEQTISKLSKGHKKAA